MGGTVLNPPDDADSASRCQAQLGCGRPLIASRESRRGLGSRRDACGSSGARASGACPEAPAVTRERRPNFSSLAIAMRPASRDGRRGTGDRLGEGPLAGPSRDPRTVPDSPRAPDMGRRVLLQGLAHPTCSWDRAQWGAPPIAARGGNVEARDTIREPSGGRCPVRLFTRRSRSQDAEVPCPRCKVPVPADDDVCNVCGWDMRDQYRPRDVPVPGDEGEGRVAS